MKRYEYDRIPELSVTINGSSILFIIVSISQLSVMKCMRNISCVSSDKTVSRDVGVFRCSYTYFHKYPCTR